MESTTAVGWVRNVGRREVHKEGCEMRQAEVVVADDDLADRPLDRRQGGSWR